VVAATAILVSACVYGLGYRQQGSDLSQMLLIAAGRSPLNFVPLEPSHGGSPRSWVFIDLRLQLCHAATLRCRNANALRQTRIAQVLRRIREAGPRLVVIDVLLAGGQADQSVLSPSMEEALAQPGPPVLLAWDSLPSRHNPNRALVYLESADSELIRPGTHGSGRFLPAVISGGPVSRELTPAICLQGEGLARVVPTLSYGAAMIALDRNAGLSRIDDYLTGRALVPSDAPSNACRSLPDAPRSEAFRQTERVFSAGSPRWSPDGDDASRWLSADNWLVFRTNGSSQHALPLQEMADGVIVIGSSAEDAADTHWTSLGQMTGGEIVLNDIRQFVLSAPHPPPGTLGTLVSKLPFFVAGLIAAFIAWLLLPRRAGVASQTVLRGVLMRFALVARAGLRLGLLIGLTAVFFVLLLYLFPEHLGSPPDFITPFVALAAEGLFEIGFQLVLAMRTLLNVPEPTGMQ